jgi:hypothetical protein
VYPVASSLALLASAGVTSAAFAQLLLYGGAALDLVLGVATLVARPRRGLWLAQIGVIVLYTTIITVRLPALWLEPFGPVLKNVPLLAALWLLYELEER